MEKFRKYPDDLFVAKRVNNDKGAVLKLDPTIKQIYLYMLLKYEFFARETTEKVFFENQDVIGEHCGLSRHTVIRTVEKLKEIGLVQVHKKRLGNGAWSNNYIIHRIDGEKWWYDDNRGKKTYTRSQKPVVPKHQPPEEFDDYPF